MPGRGDTARWLAGRGRLKLSAFWGTQPTMNEQSPTAQLCCAFREFFFAHL